MTPTQFIELRRVEGGLMGASTFNHSLAKKRLTASSCGATDVARRLSDWFKGEPLPHARQIVGLSYDPRFDSELKIYYAPTLNDSFVAPLPDEGIAAFIARMCKVDKMNGLEWKSHD